MGSNPTVSAIIMFQGNDIITLIADTLNNVPQFVPHSILYTLALDSLGSLLVKYKRGMRYGTPFLEIPLHSIMLNS